ncbi:TetR/AcrR family transcriptional regulator [Streptomyces nitrosporeus]|uniref:TetR/AcrR family transcriptional regulator n=1 Tax=Streptomyces nitrosporeus TaxID=28894 RepID=UPI0033179C95
MAKQERASRTRRALLEAAAKEFDRHGYAGSSLAQIARSADISLGALTFHFPSKRALAESVRERGNEATLALVDRLNGHEGSPVQYVSRLTLALAALLEEDAAVRAAARLAREESCARHEWHALWAPVLCERLRRALPSDVPPGTDMAAIADMAVHLVSGIEATLRHLPCPGEPDDRVGRLARIWQQALPDIALSLNSGGARPLGVADAAGAVLHGGAHGQSRPRADQRSVRGTKAGMTARRAGRRRPPRADPPYALAPPAAAAGCLTRRCTRRPPPSRLP